MRTWVSLKRYKIKGGFKNVDGIVITREFYAYIEKVCK